MTTTTKLRLGLLALFVCLNLLPLGARPLMEPDETRYAEVPREMLATGNWVAPHLDGLRYFEKPPLGYWANAISMKLLGGSAFAIRLPSALSVGLSALVILLLGRRFLPPEEVWAGPLASLIFLTSGEVIAVGTFSVMDSMLSAALTLTLAAFLMATQARPRSSGERGWLVAAGVSCGIAFLLKGFLALVVPGVSVGAYLLWERRGRDLWRLAWLPLVVATLTVLPWAGAIWRREPDFWSYFFWVEHVHRFLGGGGAQHPQGFWFFFLFGPLMFMPWSFLAPAAVRGLRQSGPVASETRTLCRFCLCWFGLPFLFFSLSSGKLLTYILPCFPPLAMLTSLGLLAALRAGRERGVNLGAGALGALFLLAGLGLLLVQTVGLPGVTPPYPAAWQWRLGLLGLSGFAGLSILAALVREPGTKLILFGLGPVALFLVAPFIMPPQSIERKSPSVFLDQHRPEIAADTVIFSDEDPLRAVCWAFKRDDVTIVGGGGELSYGLSYPDARGRMIAPEQLAAALAAHRGQAVLVAASDNYRTWRQQLPPPRRSYSSGPKGYVLAWY